MSDVFDTSPKKRQSVLGSTVNKWLKSSHDFLSQIRIARFGVFSPKGVSGLDNAAIIVGEAVIAGIAVTYTVTTLSNDYQSMVRRQLREFDTDLLNQRLFSDGRDIQWIIDAGLLLSNLNDSGAFHVDEELFAGVDIGSVFDNVLDDDNQEKELTGEDDPLDDKTPVTQPPPTDDGGGDDEGNEDTDDGSDDRGNEDGGDEDSDDDTIGKVDDDDLLLVLPPPTPVDEAPVVNLNDYATTFTENNYAVQTTPTAVNVVDVNNVTISDAEGVLESVTITISNLSDTGFETLSATASGSISIDSSTPGTLILTGASSNTDYEDVLKTVTYVNTSDSPTQTDRTITITADDGNSTTSDTTTISVVAVNDDDVFSFTNADFDANDTIKGDSGNDTIRFTNAATILAAALANKTGVDVVQFDGTGNSMTFDAIFVGNSDSDSVELNQGSNTITSLDVSNVNSAHTVVIGGTGAVTLVDGVNNKVSAKDGVNTSITGGTGNDTILGDTGNDTFIGGDGTDSLTGGDGADSLTGGSGNDTIIGGAGDDTLVGGQGVDSITGGSGDDIYQWTANNESGIGAGSRDIITDFSQSDTDQMDLSFISNGQYIGIYDFMSGTNTVRYEQSGGNTIVEADSDGDGTTDFEIELTGTISLTRDDFIGLSANNPIEVSDLNGTTGFQINGIDANDRAGSSVSTAGDFNNDGFDDFIISARDADPNGNSRAGETYLIFGKAANFSTPFELSDINGTNGFQINGISGGDQSGLAISEAGDFNGDGISDIIIGARFGDANASNAGETYIVFGTTSSLGINFDLSDLNGTNGFRLDGISANDESGIEINKAGDINNDGYDDVVISAYLADPNGSASGETYVVFGAATQAGSSFDLSDLNGTNGFQLNGIDTNDELRTVGPAGDLNGDGFDDVIVHASHGDPNGLSNAGESYVIYGKSSGFSASIELSDLNGTNGFQINGTTAGNEEAGVHTLGDINGDGIDDLIIASRYGDANGLIDAGQAYVIYGSISGFTDPFELSDLNGTNGFVINGSAAGNEFYVHNVDGADVNADGYNDIIIGSRLADPNGLSNAGEVYVIFGGTSLAATFEISDLNGLNGFQFNGESAGDNVGWSANTAGDINGDGYEDVIIGARLADPNGLNRAGEGYVIYGSDHTYQATHLGTTGNDGSLAGDSSANYIDALAGNDNVTGDGGNDTLIGGQGNDTLDGGTGNDVLIAASGDDRVIYDSADTLRVDGGSGTDTLAFNSSVTLSASDLNAFDNFEVFEFGGTGNSLVINQNIINRIDGTSLELANSSNTITSLNTSGINNGSVIISGTGAITLSDAANHKVTSKDSVNTRINGGTGSDTLIGGTGNDTYSAGSGADSITGGSGVDSLSGGSGNDVFVWTSTSESGIGSGNRDIVTDFSTTDDTLDLSALNNLAFLGISSFVSGLNSVRYEQTGGNTIIQVDSNGDATTDFEIELTGLLTLTSSNILNSSDPVTLDLNGTDPGTNFSAAFVEDAGAVTIVDTDATLTDSDDTSLESGTVTISNLLDGTDESLGATTTGTNVTANYDSGTGVLTLSGTDTLANYLTVLKTVTYNNTSNTPNTTDRTIDFVLNDGTSNGLTSTTTLSVAATNDPPVVDLNGSGTGGTGFSNTFTENDYQVSTTPTPVNIADSSNALLSDPEGDVFTSVTITITNLLDTGFESLAATASGSVTINSSTPGVLILENGTSNAEYQAVLRTVTYVNTDDDPNTTDRSISVVANDGTDTTSATATISITPVTDNDTFTSSDAAFTSSSTIVGDGGTDRMVISDAANISTSDLTNKSNLEELELQGATNTVALTDAFVDSSSTDQVELIFGANTVALDTSNVNAARDVIIGSAGVVTLSGNSRVLVKAGVDASISGSNASETILGNSGDDTFSVALGSDSISGGDGNDVITGTGSNSVDGGAGDDSIVLSAGSGAENNTVIGGAGLDTITTTAGSDNITDTLGAASISSGSGSDTIVTGDSNDTINAGNGTNSITSGEGDDVITGSGHNYVDAGAGNDTITLSNNTISGSATEHDTVIGGAGLDVITTASGNDSITDTLGAASINSGSGSDTIVTGVANDTIIAGVGANNITAGDGDDSITNDDSGGGSTILAGDGDDTIIGTGDNSVVAGDGNDLITLSLNIVSGPASEDNTVDGGAGLDTITTTAGNDSITDTLGAASISSGSGSDTITTGDANDTINAGNGTNSITSGEGDDVITGSGHNYVDAGAGNDTITLSNNTISGSATEHDTVIGGAGLDVITTASGNDSITDTLGAASINSGSGSDTIVTGVANDTIIAGVGTNNITAGDGDDSITNDDSGGGSIILAGDGDDTIIGTGDNSVVAGDGDDLITLSLNIVSGPASEDNTVDGGAGLDTITTTAGNDSITDTLGAASISSGSGSDTITTGDANDTINAGNGTNSITSGEGDDVITGSGHNYVDAGAGNDTITLSNNTISGSATEHDTVIGGAGLDVITTASGNDSITDTLGAASINSGSGSDTIVTGVANDTIIAGVGTNNITAGDGDDSITNDDSGGGSIILAGDGDDTIIGTGDNSVVAGDGDDLITLSLNIVSGPASEDNTVDGGAGLDTITTTAGNDSITDTLGAASISSGSGSDTITTGDANDTINAGTGNDSITSGDGNDIITATGSNFVDGGAGNDSIVLSAGAGAENNTVIGGAGLDTITTSTGSDSITDTLEAASINSGSGNDTIITGAGNDTIDAGQGSNSISSGNGNDVITALSSTNNSIDMGAGDDSITLALGTFATTTIDAGSGSDTISGFFNSSGKFLITDTIGAANITTGNGADTITTGIANDTIVSNSGNDSILSGDGDDSITTTGGSNTILSGDGNDTVTGTNNGNNSIELGVGDDSLSLGLSSSVIATIDAGSGNDIITNTAISSGAFFITDTIGTADITTGRGNDTITTGSGNDTIDADRGDNSIVSGDGDDVITALSTGSNSIDAGGGNDSITVTLGTFATTTIDAGSGSDTISGFFNSSGRFLITDTIGAGSITTGNGADTITTGSGNDTIVSNSGNDSITAGAGVDSLTSGTGTDTLIWNAASESGVGSGNRDIITDFTIGTDQIDVSTIGSFTFVGTTAFSGSKNEIRYTQTGGNTIVEVDSDNDGTTNFEIELTGLLTPTVDDIIGAAAPPSASFELSSLDGSNGFQLNGVDAGDNAGWHVRNAGDINGDGFDDILVSALNADPNSTNNAGETYVVFGRAADFTTPFELSSLAGGGGTNGFQINGPDTVDSFAGNAITGDINGDGINDLLIGAYNSGGSDEGGAYVIFGKTTAFSQTIDVTDLNGTDGFAITAPSTTDQLTGFSVHFADINNDGIDDAILGAPSDAASVNNIGKAYVVFGKTSSFGSSFDLTDLNGTNGFEINGTSTDDELGRSVSAGDINGDGIEDLILGVPSGDPGSGTDAGQVAVIFGSSSFSSTVEMSDLNGTNGFVVEGVSASDISGMDVSNAGDVNGDGIDDLLLGAPDADPNSKSSAGQAYVVFGSTSAFSATFALSDLNGSNGFEINGDTSGDELGRWVSGGGDFNGDGFDDILVGAPFGDPNATSDASEYYVIFGGSSFSTTLEVSDLDGTSGFILNGISANDYGTTDSADPVSFGGDINGDGFDDIVVAAQGGDPNSNADSGESYVIYGYDYTNTATNSGTSGNDTLTGTANDDFLEGLAGNDSLTGAGGDDTLIGGQGDDTLDGGGGADNILGGAGDDILAIDDLTYFNIDGGSGMDTLRFDGSGMNMNLSTLSQSRIEGIEVIDLTGSGNNSLTLTLEDVFDLSEELNTLPSTDSDNTLFIDGNSGDSVTSTGAGWSSQGTVTINMIDYTHYTSGDGHLYVDTDISATIS